MLLLLLQEEEEQQGHHPRRLLFSGCVWMEIGLALLVYKHWPMPWVVV